MTKGTKMTPDAQDGRHAPDLSEADIRSMIFTVRGVQVIVDSDLAAIYHVSTGAFNQAVKRNISRFPDNFRFQLTADEHRVLLSQIVMAKKSAGQETRGGRRNLPYVFTEQGVGMLSGVLRSDVAIQTSIRLMNAFVVMHRTLLTLGPMLTRIEAAERAQLEDRAKLLTLQTEITETQQRNEELFGQIFDAMADKSFPPQKVFYDGQLWDARSLVERLIASARKSITLIDNWVGVATLDMLAKKRKGVKVLLVTSEHVDRRTGVPRPTLQSSDIAKFNQQYPTLTQKFNEQFHDRFLFVDEKELYLFGASLKDLGKKCFALTKLDASEIAGLKARI